MNLNKLAQHALPFVNGCNNHWLNAKTVEVRALPSHLQHWLLDKNSLTQRLIAQCQQFSVQVLQKKLATLANNEQHLFDMQTTCLNNSITSREVLLLCDLIPQVYARTLIPEQTMHYANNQLQHLGNTSLGEVLFQSPNMRRGDIEVTSFAVDSDMAKFCQPLALPCEHVLWARRSMFYLDDHPLMVSEVFLPGAFAYNDNGETSN
ncbi:MAG: chorismate lyase [Psychrobium sp.]|nr:chorismate lyase [Psychrobium sp.]